MIVTKMWMTREGDTEEEKGVVVALQTKFERKHTDFVTQKIDQLPGDRPDAIIIGLSAMINMAVELLVKIPPPFQRMMLDAVAQCLADNFGTIHADPSNDATTH